MDPIPPQWFKQRQCKLEAVGPSLYRVAAPQQADAFLSIRQAEDGRYAAGLRLAADGPEMASTEAKFAQPGEAWEAAFELYRQELIT